MVLNFNDLVIEVNESGFGQFVIEIPAEVVDNVDALYLWIFIIDNFIGVFEFDLVLKKAKFERFGLGVVFLGAVLTDYMYFTEFHGLKI